MSPYAEESSASPTRSLFLHLQTSHYPCHPLLLSIFLLFDFSLPPSICCICPSTSFSMSTIRTPQSQIVGILLFSTSQHRLDGRLPPGKTPRTDELPVVAPAEDVVEGAGNLPTSTLRDRRLEGSAQITTSIVLMHVSEHRVFVPTPFLLSSLCCFCVFSSQQRRPSSR